MGKQIKQALRANRLVKVAYLGQFCTAKMVDIIGLTGGYDGVWFDLEHTSLTLAEIENCCRAAQRVGLDQFVRLAATDYAAVMRPLECGAGGIMAAQVRTAEETENVVRWAKFHPRGIRGLNGTGTDGSYGKLPVKEYIAKQNEETLIAVQIENVEAVRNVDAIAKVSDLDLLFIGPADLSQSLGIPGEWNHPKLWGEIERVAHAASANGIHWAILPANSEIARRCVDMGCRLLSLGVDASVIRSGWKSTQVEYSEFFVCT